jgi:DNA-binding GntR family transcriptional regulator
MALAVRALGASEVAAPPDPRAVLKMVERVMREGDVRRGAIGADLSPADARALLQAWLALGIEVPTAFAVYWTYFDPIELVEFHAPIADAVRAGDAARAGAEARAHVRRTEKVVRRRRKEAR